MWVGCNLHAGSKSAFGECAQKCRKASQYCCMLEESKCDPARHKLCKVLDWNSRPHNESIQAQAFHFNTCLLHIEHSRPRILTWDDPGGLVVNASDSVPCPDVLKTTVPVVLPGLRTSLPPLAPDKADFFAGILPHCCTPWVSSQSPRTACTYPATSTRSVTRFEEPACQVVQLRQQGMSSNTLPPTPGALLLKKNYV